RLGPGSEDRPPLIAGNRIKAGVRGHAVQPRAQRRAFLQTVAIPPGAQQSLLHRILGVRQGAEHAVTVDQKLAAMTLNIATEFDHVGASVPGTPTNRRRSLLVIPERGRKLIVQWRSEFSRTSNHAGHRWMAMTA